jgi:diguanylate cyclase (GGDEF)-like protein
MQTEMHHNRGLSLRGRRSARRASGPRASQATLILLMVGNLAFFTAWLVLRHGAAYSPVLDGWISNLSMLVPTAACLVRAVRGGPRRAAAIWLGMGMLSWTAGNVIYTIWTQFQTHPSVPSPADISYLGFYVCVAAALVCLVRADLGSFTRSLWLDGALGAAGGATALAAALSPVFSGGPAQPLGVVLVGAAYAIADLVLFAMICGLLAARGTRGGSMWLWLAGGLVIFCATDVTYALQVNAGTYVVGTFLNGLWALGIAVIAFAIWRPQRPAEIGSGRSQAILAVPMLATLTAVSVLVISSVGRLPTAVVALATLTLLLAAARTSVSFRQVRRLSDARRQALTDELTGLGNRRYLFESGEERRLAAAEGERLALILIDLDNFKEVNDTLGHHAGDAFLRETARRLAARVAHPELLVRLGGDEFALVTTLATADDGREIALRILDRLAQSFVVEGIPVRVDASAGVAETESAGVEIAELLRRADVAMYAAKASRSRVELYDPELDEANRTRLDTVHDLDAALAGHQFVLHYQPKIDVQSGAAIGAEALVRWQHPTRGLLYPDAFLPVVEQSGLMPALTRLVLEAAVVQLASWRRDGLVVTLAVNLSASDLLDESLAERITALLAEHDVPVSALELEITESVLMIDPVRAAEVLAGLRRLGLRIAVDDYGTGYCALAYLRDLPIDELKIDRSFVAHVTADPRTAAIVRSTIELAHALDLKVVAEGVEHAADLEALADFGCDFAQGYHFSRPLPAEPFTRWIRARAPGLAPERLPRFVATVSSP